MSRLRDDRAASDAFEAWVDEARKIRVAEWLGRKNLWSRKMIGDAGVPCPGCGGTDRFAVNTKKNLFICRASGAGGDAIAAAEHIFGLPFIDAVEDVGGSPPPEFSARESTADRAARVARLAKLQAEAAEQQQREAKEADGFRENERQAAWRLWQAGRPIASTPAEDYLALRRLMAPAGAHLRYLPEARYYDRPGGTCLHVGPAMAGAVIGAAGRFIGLHRTWIDLRRPKGKLAIADPETGEILPAKKMRGSWKGGAILLGRSASAATGLVLGEGIETVLAFRQLMLEADPEFVARAEFRAAVALDNLGGKAAARVAHPTETRTDKRGRVRHVLIGSDEPALYDDIALIAVPECVDDIVLLRDSDSEPVRTANAMLRAAKRFHAAYPHLGIRIELAPEGMDFGDVWMRRAA